MTLIVFVLHITGGTIGLVAGSTAMFALKGGPLHRLAGNVFFVSMLVMAAFADVLAVIRPGQIINLFIGTFAFYLVATAWLTVRREENTVGLTEKIALAIIAVLCVAFAVLAFQQLVMGKITLFKSGVPIEGPVLIALYSFASIVFIAAISDAKVVLSGGIAGVPRIARHLWRMCLGLMLAAGSAFTNGLPRLLPGPMRVTPIYFVPQLLVLGLLIFWLIRVRVFHWLPNERHAHLAPKA